MNSIDDIRQAYDRRAPQYDEQSAWHISLAQEFTNHLPLEKGQSLLDLCCGTGSVAIDAKRRLGHGVVHGIDISSESLKLARLKAEKENLEISLIEADCSDVSRVVEQEYDYIALCSALVLFKDPVERIRSWLRYLIQGGIFITDVPAADTNWASNLFIDSLVDVGLQGTEISSRWVKDHTSIREVLERAGLREIHVLDSARYNRVEHEVSESDDLFNKQLGSDMWLHLKTDANEERLARAKGLYREKCQERSEKQGSSGVFTSDTQLYIATGRK